MAGRTVLIDGYNVIGADPVLSALQRTSLESSRTALLNAVAGSPRFLGDVVTVVFDGRDAVSVGSNHRVGHVTATYSSAGLSADDVIKARAKASTSPASTVVVTNDIDIREYCRLLGCQVTGSQNLLDQLSVPRPLAKSAARINREPDEAYGGTLSTKKRGNPKRQPKRSRDKDIRF